MKYNLVHPWPGHLYKKLYLVILRFAALISVSLVATIMVTIYICGLLIVVLILKIRNTHNKSIKFYREMRKVNLKRHFFNVFS